MPRQNEQWEIFYKTAWKERANLAEHLISKGIKDPFILLQTINRYERNYELKVNPKSKKPTFIKRSFEGLGGTFPTGKPYLKYLPVNEDWLKIPYYPDPVDFILDFLEGKDFEAIVELGSGHGGNLIELFYRGGPTEIPYYAGEYTESGNQLINIFSSLREDLNLIPFQFDYKKPDLSVVKEKKKLFIFTSHSIEQVAEISRDLFTYLANYAEHVTCIHFEPFGFQTGQHLGRVSKFQASYFKKRDWNLNLGPVLLEAQKAGDIDIKFMAKNVISTTHDNPTSVAIWESPKSPKN